MKGRQNKYILKEAARGLIPDDIIYRKKQGFGVPVHSWMLGALGAFAREEIMNFATTTDLLNPGKVKAVIDRNDGPRIWYLLNLALWWKHYIAREPINPVSS